MPVRTPTGGAELWAWTAYPSKVLVVLIAFGLGCPS